MKFRISKIVTFVTICYVAQVTVGRSRSLKTKTVVQEKLNINLKNQKIPGRSKRWNYSGLKQKYMKTDFMKQTDFYYNQNSDWNNPTNRIPNSNFYNSKTIFYNQKCYHCLFKTGNYYYCVTIEALQKSLRPVSSNVFGDEFASSLDTDNTFMGKSCSGKKSAKIVTFSFSNKHKELVRSHDDAEVGQWDSDELDEGGKVLKLNGYKYRACCMDST